VSELTSNVPSIFLFFLYLYLHIFFFIIIIILLRVVFVIPTKKESGYNLKLGQQRVHYGKCRLVHGLSNNSSKKCRMEVGDG